MKNTRQNAQNLNFQKLSRQHGATMWTMLFNIFVIGFLAFMAIKLLPEYMEFGTIRSSMQEVVNQHNFREMTSKQILTAMSKRLQVDSVRGFSKDSFSVAQDKKTSEKYILINYEKKIPLFSNISVLLEFNEEVRTKR
ncbi:DUF4845 domain-containing protein [Aliikangiella maris]|uniref:DUF4845 domain-containing protein n=2 Tax=Aliikangiella maris TaxID=3162458 RepID=A0ABV3MMT6_9GAMM